MNFRASIRRDHFRFADNLRINESLGGIQEFTVGSRGEVTHQA
jgi:hypothetical protein